MARPRPRIDAAAARERAAGGAAGRIAGRSQIRGARQSTVLGAAAAGVARLRAAAAGAGRRERRASRTPPRAARPRRASPEPPETEPSRGRNLSPSYARSPGTNGPGATPSADHSRTARRASRSTGASPRARPDPDPGDMRMPCAPNGSVVTGPTGRPADDAGLLVIEQRQHLGVILWDQERSPPELWAPVFEAVDQLGHVRTLGVYRRWRISKAPRSPTLSSLPPTGTPRSEGPRERLGHLGRTSIELWFDFSCPFAYLASRRAPSLPARSHRLAPDAARRRVPRTGAGDGPMATLSPQKALPQPARYAPLGGSVRQSPFRMPAAHPMRTVRALRTLLALPAPAGRPRSRGSSPPTGSGARTSPATR